MVEDVKLPDLPGPNNFPALSDVPDLEPKNPANPYTSEMHVDTFPSYPNHQGINNAMTPEHDSGFRPLGSPPEPFGRIHAEPVGIEAHQPRSMEIENQPIQTTRQIMNRRIDPVFIRLDKFETSLEALEEIKDRIVDIEGILAKTKDIREKEDKEIEEWEREIQIIKSKIEAIDKSVFSKLD